MPTFAPKIYPDVVKDLTWWAGILLTVVVYAIPSILPPTMASAVRDFAGGLPSKGFVEPVFVVGVLAAVLVFFVRIHELYDQYVVRWRVRYDLDVIVPTLVEPLIERIDPAFLVVARDRRREVMNLYYHFVRDGKPLISENLVLRFYLRILRYWLTYLNEMALIGFVVVVVLSLAVSWGEGADLRPGALGLCISIVLIVMNRWLMGVWRKSVERATGEEIENIHEEHLPELEERLQKLHARLNLTYRQGA